ncbi:MAG: GNAT family N-acetyltransferase [Caldilineaceae bacterium]|nr:GNAT family N-acetyltransferase [Caldilineaceae bacterium]
MMFTEDMHAIRALLNQDPVWSAYALADLQPAFAPRCRWLMAENGGGPGVVLLYAGLIPTVLFSAGAAGAVQVGLAQAGLPAEVYVTIPQAHLPVVAQHYEFGASLMPMVRMIHTGGGNSGEVDGGGADRARSVVRLSAGDAGRIQALYAHGGLFTPDAFDPYQLPDGVFYGVEDAGGALVAVGGTHIVDWQTGIAAIGNMYTRPDGRRQGWAGVVLRAIMDELTGRGVGSIVLNVAQANTGARRLYTRHGFAVHCVYWEGVGRRREG